MNLIHGMLGSWTAFQACLVRRVIHWWCTAIDSTKERRRRIDFFFHSKTLFFFVCCFSFFISLLFCSCLLFFFRSFPAVHHCFSHFSLPSLSRALRCQRSYSDQPQKKNKKTEQKRLKECAYYQLLCLLLHYARQMR